MICFGASKIIMGLTSELGPVDPQLTTSENNIVKRFSVYNIVESYDDLFRRAIETKGNLQLFLQQLANYDEREIKEFRNILDLSKDIAIRTLATGVMSGQSDKDIEEKIKIFLTPERTKIHGRPIYKSETADCGLMIESADIKDKLWELIYELYIRTDNFVGTKVAKCIESKEHSFFVNFRE